MGGKLRRRGKQQYNMHTSNPSAWGGICVESERVWEREGEEVLLFLPLCADRLREGEQEWVSEKRGGGATGGAQEREGEVWGRLVGPTR